MIVIGDKAPREIVVYRPDPSVLGTHFGIALRKWNAKHPDQVRWLVAKDEADLPEQAPYLMASGSVSSGQASGERNRCLPSPEPRNLS